jgi:tRNA 2-thiouridine synthesizing protein A
MNYDYLVDATEDVCPMPLLRAKMQLNKMQEGECVKVLASDAASVRDFSSFAALAGHELISEVDTPSEGAHTYVYYIIKR